jgi:hypothetical protein
MAQIFESLGRGDAHASMHITPRIRSGGPMAGCCAAVAGPGYYNTDMEGRCAAMAEPGYGNADMEGCCAAVTGPMRAIRRRRRCGPSPRLRGYGSGLSSAASFYEDMVQDLVRRRIG